MTEPAWRVKLKLHWPRLAKFNDKLSSFSQSFQTKKRLFLFSEIEYKSMMSIFFDERIILTLEAWKKLFQSKENSESELKERVESWRGREWEEKVISGEKEKRFRNLATLYESSHWLKLVQYHRCSHSVKFSQTKVGEKIVGKYFLVKKNSLEKKGTKPS